MGKILDPDQMAHARLPFSCKPEGIRSPYPMADDSSPRYIDLPELALADDRARAWQHANGARGGRVGATLSLASYWMNDRSSRVMSTGYGAPVPLHGKYQ